MIGLDFARYRGHIRRICPIIVPDPFLQMYWVRYTSSSGQEHCNILSMVRTIILDIRIPNDLGRSQIEMYLRWNIAWYDDRSVRITERPFEIREAEYVSKHDGWPQAQQAKNAF